MLNKFSTIPINSEGFDENLMVEMHPEPLFHYSMGDRVTSEWDYKINSARRFQSSEFINFFHIGEKYHPMMRLNFGEKILAALPPERIVLYTDAFDVLFNDSLHSLLLYFLQMESLTPPDQFGRKPAIIFNGEKGCWPEPQMSGNYPQRDRLTEQPFLNSGIMIGRCGAILDIFRSFQRSMLTEDKLHGAFWKDVKERVSKTDDQCFWTNVYLRSLDSPDFPRIEVDHQARFACCMFAQPNDVLAVSNDIFFMRRTGVRPLLLHFNGPTKAAMRGVAAHLAYLPEQPIQ